MLNAIKSFFDKHLAPEGDGARQDPEHALRVATAALLAEMTRTDHEVSAEEREMVDRLLAERFDLTAEEAGELAQLAHSEARESTDYYQFTSLIREAYGQEQRIKVIELLWQVAAADGRLDKYEEHMVRKIAELLYVAHSDFIAAKHRVLGE